MRKRDWKKVEKIETPQLTRTPAQRYKDLEARLDEMNRSGEGSGSDPQKYEAPVPSTEGQTEAPEGFSLWIRQLLSSQW